MLQATRLARWVLVTTTALLTTAGAAQAQNQNARHQGAGIGIKGGPIFSSFDSARQDFGNNTGFEGGLFFGGNRGGVVGVQGEVLYAKKGSSEIDLRYLEIPVLLRINIGSNSLNGFNVYGLGGPVADIQIQATGPNGEKLSDYFERGDVGFLLGGGLEITRFIIEGRYNWGLRSVIREQFDLLNFDFGDVDKIKNRSFAVLFGIRFN